MTSVICNFCDSEIIKYNLIKHQKSDTCTKIKNLLNKQKDKYENLFKNYLFLKDINNFFQ
jgi:hypothetical protein